MSAQPGGFLPPLDPQGQGTDTRRWITTALLLTAMWLGIQALFPAQPEPKAAAATPAVQPTGSGAAGIGATAPDAAIAGAAGATIPGATPADLPEVTRTFSADVAKATGADDRVAVKGGYQATVTSHGAQLQSIKLDGYADAKNAGKPVDLVPAAHEGAAFFALRSRGGDVALAADAAYSIVSEDARAVSLDRLTASGVRVTRTTTFDPDRFAFTTEIVLKNESPEKKSASFDVVLTGVERKGERDEGGLFAPTPDALAGACRVADDREHFTSRDVEKEPESFEGRVGYAAIDRHYFLAAVLFDDVATERCVARSFRIDGAEGKSQYGFSIVVEQAPVPLAPGEVKTLRYLTYAGPKQVGLLQAFGHGLEENIDFGIFGVISRPMLWILVRLHEYTGNFGIAIILLTLLMKALTFPLTQKSYVGMQQMKKVAPQIKELQTKYGNDRTVLGQKQMELYQSQGINPMAGCLPLLVQMPIWFALYRTLSQAVELYQQPFYWGILDLTQPDYLLPFSVSLLPIIVGALMLWQTWMQPPPEDQPQMKYVLWGMPIMFTFLMLSMASGLSIYMITNSLLTMAQQYYIKRKYA